MAPTLLQSRYLRRALIAGLADVACFLAAATIAWFVLAPPIGAHEYAMAVIVGAALAIVALGYCAAYAPAVLGSARGTLRSITTTTGLAFAAALAIYFLVHIPAGITGAAAHTAALFFPLLWLERAAFRFASSRLTHRVIVIGVSELGADVARVLRERPNMGLELVGFLSDDDALQGEMIEGFRVLGRPFEIEKLVDGLKIQRIVVASRDRDEDFPAEQLLAAKLRGCHIDSGLAFLERTIGRIYVRELRESYLVFSDGFHSGPFAAAAKRAFDLVAATVALLLASPLLVLAAVAIRLDTPGPVFYRQERVGRNARVFQVLKLRSMRDGAEDETGAVFASAGDDRITRVGRILRRTRLDEVPQFWQVLLGEMSVVGPRPERPEFVEALTEQYPCFRLRTSVKPGVTGWAQIRYGYVNDLDSFEQKLSFDLFYLKYQSLGLDLLILWATIKTVVLLRGL